MKKTRKLLSVLAALSVILCSIPFLTLATTTMPENLCEINLTELAVSENNDYKVESSRILLKNREKTYVLSGTTSKNIVFSNNPADYSGKTYYIRLKGVNVTGNFQQGNNKDWNVVLDIAANTTNTVNLITLTHTEIVGTGTLNTKNISTAVKDDSSLSITDATVNITPPTNGVSWSGNITLSGSANVKITGNGIYPPLKIGEQFKSTLTLNNNAKLSVLQDDFNTASSSTVDGIEMFKQSEIILNNNSQLKAEGKKCTNSDYHGFAILSYDYDSTTNSYVGGNITVNDSAVLEAKAYGNAIYIGALTQNGGKVISQSESGNAIITLKKSDFKNAVVYATGGDGYYSLYSFGNITIENSWVECGSSDKLTTISDSVVFKGKQGTAYGNHTIPCDITLNNDYELSIPENTSVTVPENTTFTNNGSIEVKGQFIKSGGTIICNRHADTEFENNETEYWLTCPICETEYFKSDIPIITINGKNKICKTQDYTFTFSLPNGVAFPEKLTYSLDNGEVGTFNFTENENGYTVVIPHGKYKSSKKLIIKITTTTDEGFPVETEKTVEICDHTDEIKLKDTVIEKTSENAKENNTVSPKTQDSTSLAVWVSLLLLSGTFLLLEIPFAIKNKKCGKNQI